MYGTWLHLLRGELTSALETSEAGLEAAIDIGASTLESSFKQALAWTKCETESSATSARALEQLANRALDSGRSLTVAYSYAIAGLTYGRADQAARGLELAERGVELAERLGEHYAYPEILRARTLLRFEAGGSKDMAIAGFTEALAVAERLGMRSWGLRIATDLARLHADNRDEAHKVLQPVYASFDEGHETRDLKAARAVLEGVG